MEVGEKFTKDGKLYELRQIDSRTILPVCLGEAPKPRKKRSTTRSKSKAKK